MSANEFRAAKEVHWVNPTGKRMLLSPFSTEGSMLEVRIDQGAIEIRGINCLLISFGTSIGAPGIETPYETIHITISTSSCQITWDDGTK